jgi:pilus assembly protein CpaE
MGIADICVHNIADSAIAAQPHFRVVAQTSTREDLRRSVGTLAPSAVVIDLDDPDALAAVVEIREIRSDLAVVGLTGQTDAKFLMAAVRAGCAQLSTKPLDLDDLTNALRRALRTAALPEAGGRTLGVIGAAGGAGATTLACYLAVGVADATHARTLLVDGDLDFGGVARAWDLTPSRTIGDVATAGTVDARVLEKAVVDLAGGVSILARPAQIEQAQAIDDVTMSQVIRTARGAYPNVVVDLPRKLDAVTGATLELCDKLLVVMQLTVPALDNARRLIEALIGQEMPSDRIEVVVNRYRKNVHKLSSEHVEKQLRRKILGVVPNDYRAVAAAIDIGQPVAVRNPVRTAIADIAARLTGHGAAPAANGGWLSRFGFGRADATPDQPVG